MTIRVRRSQKEIEAQQIAALITQSILRPTSDDAPSAIDPRPYSAWLSWGQSQRRPPHAID